MVKTVAIFCGATASGKSSQAIKYALQNNGVIINCDSQQIYKDLEILSARPSKEEENEVPHKLYGFLSNEDTFKNFTVAKWCQLAKTEIEKCWSKNKLPILVGGTGFYIKAFIEGLSPIPTIPEDKRAQIHDKYRDLTNEELHKHLCKIDNITSEKIAIADRYRTLRAIEVFDYFNKPISELQSLPKEPIIKDCEYKIFHIKKDKEILHNKIETRFHQMVELGGLTEAKTLISKSNFNLKEGASRSIGIKEFHKYIQKEITLEEAIEEAIHSTKKYAKKQTTWFNNQLKDLPSNCTVKIIN